VVRAYLSITRCAPCTPAPHVPACAMCESIAGSGRVAVCSVASAAAELKRVPVAPVFPQAADTMIHLPSWTRPRLQLRPTTPVALDDSHLPLLSWFEYETEARHASWAQVVDSIVDLVARAQQSSSAPPVACNRSTVHRRARGEQRPPIPMQCSHCAPAQSSGPLDSRQ